MRREEKLNRKKFTIALLAALLFALSFSAEAEQPKKIRRIGFLSAEYASSVLPQFGTLQQSLHDFGYVRGKSIDIESRYADENLDRLRALAAELINANVELIVAHTSAAARAAKHSTKTIPIVIVTDGDPVEEGLVTSLARPGGNITGLTHDAPRVMEKRFEILKQTFPGISRVAFLFDASTATHSVKEAESAAKAMTIRLQLLEARGPSPSLADLFQAAADRSEALMTTSQSRVAAHRREIIGLAAKNKLPALYPSTIWSELGGFMSYGAAETDLFRLAAGYVNKFFRGAKPSEISVEQATAFELAVNLETAGQMRVTIPQTVLVRIDRLFK